MNTPQRISSLNLRADLLSATRKRAQKPSAESPQGPEHAPLDSFEALQAWQPDAPTLDTTHARWPGDAFPLGVMIEGSPAMARFVFSVAREWEAASGGLIRFSLLDASSEMENFPGIVVKWTSEATLGREFEVGHTERKVRDDHMITRATITLLENPQIDGQLGKADQLNRLRATILHEFGHALGLEHSQHHCDVMHHRGWRNAFLTPGDIQALARLYR